MGEDVDLVLEETLTVLVEEVLTDEVEVTLTDEVEVGFTLELVVLVGVDDPAKHWKYQSLRWVQT